MRDLYHVVPEYHVEHREIRDEWDVVRRLPYSSTGRVINSYTDKEVAHGVASLLDALSRFEGA